MSSPGPYAATFGYCNVLGMHAFGLVENGAYALAEERADVALAMQNTDIWAVHAMAHVYEMEVGSFFLVGRTSRRGACFTLFTTFVEVLVLAWVLVRGTGTKRFSFEQI